MASRIVPSCSRTPGVRVIVSLAALGFFVGATVAAADAAQYRVSQRGRDFQPNRISIKRGETVQIINDDADLLHHAYVNSNQFKFDSGDIAPGGNAEIKFPVAGNFNVLCGIHPKMKLVVQVE